jgi:hypothetical protein
MTNAEKYKDAIIAQICETGDWAVDKDTNKIMPCGNCDRCLFDLTACTAAFIEWLNAEYREPKKFTDDERKFIKLLDKAEWIARDYDNTLWVYLDKPYKKYNDNWVSSGEYFRISDGTSLPFSAIKSTDTEPTSRAEILGEEK